MKITVDENICIGCGTCEVMCPDCFAVEDGVSKVKKADGCESCNVKEVADACPVKAISVED